MALSIANIQRFCMHDGPGIRTVFFFKGCPLRCQWCHNPETNSAQKQLLFYPKQCIGCGKCAQVCEQQAHKFDDGHQILRERCLVCGKCVDACPSSALEICGNTYSEEALLRIAERDSAFYGSTGGITLSGGEPFFQRESLGFIKTCKRKNLSVAVETCGFCESDILKEAAPYVDLFLWDVKDTNNQRHKRFTGVGNEKILDNLKLLDEIGGKTMLRCLLINTVNTEKEHYENLAKIAKELKHCTGVKLLSYHAYGGAKATFAGLPDNGNKAWIPTEKQLLCAKQILHSNGINVL